jgi:hypothetical protein
MRTQVENLCAPPCLPTSRILWQLAPSADGRHGAHFFWHIAIISVQPAIFQLVIVCETSQRKSYECHDVTQQADFQFESIRFLNAGWSRFLYTVITKKGLND